MNVSEKGVHRRGRPRGFDDAATRRAVMHAFWRGGYAGTSMAQLVAETGLSTSSLYQAYGSKEDLFRVAFDRYVEVIGGRSWRRLATGSHGLADLAEFFDVLETVIDFESRIGCLAANTLLEFRDPPAGVAPLVELYRGELVGGLRAVLGRAAEFGEVPAARVEQMVETMVPLILGYLAITRSAAPAEYARAVLAAARRVVPLTDGTDSSG